MARLYPHYRLAEKLGTHEIVIEAVNVRELFERVRERFGEAFSTGGAAVLVNGLNINYSGGLATPVGPEDEVWMVVPAGGG